MMDVDEDDHRGDDSPPDGTPVPPRERRRGSPPCASSSMASPLDGERFSLWILAFMAMMADRGKGVPSFDEMMDIALVAVDFDDPTKNVRGRRALAIAKPTPRGY